MSIRTLARRASLVIAAAENILFAVWTDSASSVGDIQTCIPLALDAARGMKPAGLIVAIHPQTPLPAEPVRAAIQREMPTLDPYICCGATVIAREGFAGSAMRAVASTLQILSRPTHPEKIVATPKEAAEFIHREMTRHRSIVPTATAIVDFYATLTRDIWGEPPA